jgi:CxxC-x17-CxxC domain-containing protein
MTQTSANFYQEVIQMTYQDKSLQCSDCGRTFTFGAQEQEFYHTKGFTNEPKRCPECRQARKAERGDSREGGGGYGAPRQMYPVKCAQCGKDTEVPFEPRSGKPVYCSDCFRQMSPRR